MQPFAKKAFQRKTGARGLRAIIEDVMKDVMFELPSDETAGECLITKEMVLGEGGPKIRARRAGRLESA